MGPILFPKRWLTSGKDVPVVISQLGQEIVEGLLSQLPSELVSTGVVALVVCLGRLWKRRRKFSQSGASSSSEE